MKKILFPALAWMIALNLAACGGNNNEPNVISQPHQESTTPSESAPPETNETTTEMPSETGVELVKFPENYAEGVLYATVNRGNIREEIYTSREAIEAVKNGKPIPRGTVITLVDYRDGELYRYVVMEKRTGWGAQYPPELRNGQWEYQAFHADKSVNESEDLTRCLSCHAPQAQHDYVHTFDEMKNYEFK